MEIIGVIALIFGVLAYLTLYNKTTLFGKQVWRVKTDKKIIALTFDDGPNEPYTSQILALLDEFNQKATFFVVGKNVERYPGITKKQRIDGHEVGLHSYAHLFRSYFSDPLYSKQIALAQKALKAEQTIPTHFRFPWLFRTPWLVRNINRKGYGVPIGGYFAGLFEPFQPSGHWMAKRAVKLIKPGAILILHDGYNAQPANREQTVVATRVILEFLKENGYKSVTITELLALKN